MHSHTIDAAHMVPQHQRIALTIYYAKRYRLAENGGREEFESTESVCCAPSVNKEYTDLPGGSSTHTYRGRLSIFELAISALVWRFGYWLELISGLNDCGMNMHTQRSAFEYASK